MTQADAEILRMLRGAFRESSVNIPAAVSFAGNAAICAVSSRPRCGRRCSREGHTKAYGRIGRIARSRRESVAPFEAGVPIGPGKLPWVRKRLKSGCKKRQQQQERPETFKRRPRWRAR